MSAPGSLDLVLSSRSEAASTGSHSAAAANFSSTRESVFLDDMPLTSAGFSKATMAPAASFSQAFFRFVM